MAVWLEKHLVAALPSLRYQPTPKRVRAWSSGSLLADSTTAMLVWEPRRIVPSYAVPETDMRAELRPVPSAPSADVRSVGFGVGGPPLLDPSVPFTVHTAEGQPLGLVDRGPGVAFRFEDPDLQGFVALDFAAFDWEEEDEPIVSHPRDPFHRIDIRRTSRRVRLEAQGAVLAETTHARALFEGSFPLTRFYIPRADVRAELRPGSLETACAYKGRATHYTAVLGDLELPDIAWSYEDPLTDATEVSQLVAFYRERLDVLIDGEKQPRPHTPWS